MSPIRRSVLAPSACASAVSGALTSEKPFGSLLPHRKPCQQSPPTERYVRATYTEKSTRPTFLHRNLCTHTEKERWGLEHMDMHRQTRQTDNKRWGHALNAKRQKPQLARKISLLRGLSFSKVRPRQPN